MATEDAKQQTRLRLPAVQPVTYRRNLIQKTVCELKFPTLYSLERGKPPAALASALRKLYPEHSTLDGLNVGPAGVAQNFAYVFADKKSGNQIVFRAASLALETSKYRSFEDFLGRLLVVVDLAKVVIDADFFTRVGLRYINALPYDEEAIASWVNPNLVGALAGGLLGKPDEFNGRIAGKAGLGGFGFSHGIGQSSDSNKPEYVLDFDFWEEDVAITDTRAAVTRLHDEESRMFLWTLGTAALDYMGPASPKEAPPPASAVRHSPPQRI